MARISRQLLKDEVLEKLFNLFFEIVGRKNNREDFLVVPSFKKILAGEKVSGFLEELWNELFAAPGVPGINWKASWERRRKIERKKQYGI